jgi:Protein of unknown function (DUF3455)
MLSAHHTFFSPNIPILKPGSSTSDIAPSPKFKWVFKAPEADLFDASNKKVGKHYAGPVWESKDGSKVVGEVKAKADSKDKTAIPWLLLAAKSNEGKGVFSSVKSIQRVDTVGGKAPQTDCDSSRVGKQAKVSYTANYYFYIDQPRIDQPRK